MASEEKHGWSAGILEKACVYNTNLGSAFLRLRDASGWKAETRDYERATHFAEVIWRRGLTDPLCAYSRFNLGNLLRDRGETAEAARLYSEAALLQRHPTRAVYRPLPKTADSFTLASKVALNFHAQQLQELVDRGHLDRSYLKEVAACREIIQAVPADLHVRLRPEDAERIPSYRRPIYIHHQQRLPGGTIAPQDVDKVQALYEQNSLVVLDGFLKPAALEALYRFAALSQVYTDDKARGYVGSYWEHGFMTPLLLQVIEELPATFPKIFAGKHLTNVWAFNYDTEYQKGVKIHGDEAAVNCNLWVTPDDANLDKESGGLVVYTKPVPLHWDFDSYNSEAGDERMRKLLEDSNKVVVPHRQNRIVLFKSDLLHATDEMNFKKGFKNRRINLTFLYGRRGQGEDAMSIMQRTEKSIADVKKKSQY